MSKRQCWCFYHGGDLDGHCSGAAVRRWCDRKGYEFVPRPVDYGRPADWLLLIAGGALVWGACLRWPWLPKAMAAVFLALAAVGLAVALVRSATAHGGAGSAIRGGGHCTQRCGAHDKGGAA